MPTRPLFAGGVGFSPGSVRYMPTLGLTPAGSATDLTITCHGLPNSIHVQVEFEDEGWTGTDVSGFVEVYLGGAWHDGTALFKSYGVDELHGCIFGLSPNTTYPVRVTFRRYDVSGETSWAVGPNGLEDSGFDVIEEQVHEVEGTTAVDQPTFAQPRTKVYVDSENGSDSNNGLSVGGALKTLGKVGDIVQNQPGYDIVYVGKCHFENIGSENLLEDIDGAANNWNSFRPYVPEGEDPPEWAGEIIGYVEIDDTWTHVGEDIYKVSLDKPVGRVQYYDETLLQWRLLQGCRVYDGADQEPDTPTVPTLALKTGPRLSGEIEDVVFEEEIEIDEETTFENKFVITTKEAHGLPTDEEELSRVWVAVWGVKGDPEQAWTKEFEKGILKVLAVLDEDRFVVDAGTPGVYTSGGNWESQKLAGFYYKRSTEELFVRLPDESQPAAGKIRAGYQKNLGAIGRDGPSESVYSPKYVYFDLRCGLAGASYLPNGGTGDDIIYATASSHFGAIGVRGEHCIFTGSFEGSGIAGPHVGVDSVLKDCLFDNITLESFGPYDYILNRSKPNTPRMWQTMDDAVHFGTAFQVYRHDGSLWPPGIHARKAERVAVRNVKARGQSVVEWTGGTSSVEDARYIDVYDCDVADVYSAIGLSDNENVSVALYHNSFVRGYTALNLLRVGAGPLWYFANYVNDTFLKLNKHGGAEEQGGVDTGNRSLAFVLFVNNSCFDDRDTAREDSGVVSWHGRHSGAIAVNNAYSYTSATHRPVIWMNQSYSGTVAEGRINYHENNYYYTRNLGRPEAFATSHVHTDGLGTNNGGTTYANTTARDGTVHQSRSVDDGGIEKIDSRYTLNVGMGNVAKQVIWKGRIHGAGSGLFAPDNVQSMVWNNASPGGWDVLYNEYRSNGATVEKGATLLADHTATNGDVIIRFRGEGNDQWLNTVDFLAVNHGLLSWSGTYYADFTAMNAALESDRARFVDQQIVAEELVDDETGLVVSAYAEEGVYIRGITNIASLGDGQLDYDVLGYFTEFSYEQPEE